ncbi:MAG TPA: patatin-like phospholipase family protein [Thermoanaerobaculia bacterium]|nr:patatin-like phospholipase family protein [Thermoanaerobaculia bacterium]
MLNDKPWYFILAIDGGGIRGIIPASALVGLEQLIDGPIAENFDLIVGTSTGAFIALALTVPGTDGTPQYSAEDILGFYTDSTNDAQIFTLYDGSNTGGPPASWLDALDHPKYASSGVETFLSDKYGSATLADAVTSVSCVSYQISGTPGPFFFQSWMASQPGQNFLMSDAGRASGAAPLYFPPVTITSTDNSFTGTFVDGGVTANDPALVAYAEAVQLLESQGDNIENYNVWLVSIGTGEVSTAINPGDGGIWGWLSGDSLPMVTLNGPAQSTDFIAQSMLQSEKDKYYSRIEVPLQGTTPNGQSYSCAPEMDDWTQDNIQQLQLAGQVAGGPSVLADTVRIAQERRSRRAAKVRRAG